MPNDSQGMSHMLSRPIFNIKYAIHLNSAECIPFKSCIKLQISGTSTEQTSMPRLLGWICKIRFWNSQLRSSVWRRFTRLKYGPPSSITHPVPTCPHIYPDCLLCLEKQLTSQVIMIICILLIRLITEMGHFNTSCCAKLWVQNSKQQLLHQMWYGLVPHMKITCRKSLSICEGLTVPIH